MANIKQWVFTASELAEHVAGISPRTAQRAYIAAEGASLNRVIVVTSIRRLHAQGMFRVDEKNSVLVTKDQVVAFLQGKGEQLPLRTEMFVRPDPALSPNPAPSFELVLTDESNIGKV